MACATGSCVVSFLQCSAEHMEDGLPVRTYGRWAVGEMQCIRVIHEANTTYMWGKCPRRERLGTIGTDDETQSVVDTDCICNRRGLVTSQDPGKQNLFVDDEWSQHGQPPLSNCSLPFLKGKSQATVTGDVPRTLDRGGS